jgi:hypothetical protein
MAEPRRIFPIDDEAPGGKKEPYWPAILAVVTAVAMHYALPAPLRISARVWPLGGSVMVLLILATVTRRRGYLQANAVIAFIILGLLTAGLVYGVIGLVRSVIMHGTNAAALLQSASILWITNVLVFASWYWRLDAGGPSERERRAAHMHGAFLFPQMTFDSPHADDKSIAEESGWRPHFVDYLFVAFNPSTAFSPTDAPVLSKWAKMAMMVQAIISFTTVVLIAARAVNIL